MKMSLVAYGSSDEESENDQEENEKEEPVQSVQRQQTSSEEVNPKTISVGENNATLFSALPKPRKQFSFLEDSKLSKLLLNKNSFLSQKSEKESIKISIPSVSDFSEDNQPPTKKLKPSVKGVGLFSILPPPKNAAIKGSSTKLVPDSVKKVEVRKTVNKVSNVSLKNVNTSSVSKKLENDDDDDDDGDDSTSFGNSFFGSSLSEPNTSETLNDTNIMQNNLFGQVNHIESREDVQNSQDLNTIVSVPQPEYSEAESSYDNSYYPSEDTTSVEESSPAENGALELDEKALQILCGNKQKRKQIPMNVIDLSGEEIMPDSKEWLLKQLSTENRPRSFSRKKTGGPSTLQKKKHQITYLAYQAKEQELELQNQWANNRMSKKQTQSKYGF